MTIAFKKTAAGALYALLTPGAADRSKLRAILIPNGTLELVDLTAGIYRLDTDRFGNQGAETMTFAIADVDKASCSPVLTATTAENLYAEIIDRFFPNPNLLYSAYTLESPQTVVAVEGSSVGQVDVTCAAVPFAVGYTAQIATDPYFTAGVHTTSGASVPITVTGGTTGVTYYARIKATTTNPGNANSPYANAAATAVAH